MTIETAPAERSPERSDAGGRATVADHPPRTGTHTARWVAIGVLVIAAAGRVLSIPQVLNGSGAEMGKAALVLSSELIRAARALVRWEQRDLAEASSVSLPTIKRLESKPRIHGSAHVDGRRPEEGT